MTPLVLLFFLTASPQNAGASKTQPRPPDIVAVNTRETATYRRIKAYLDSIPAIDTHDHLWPFDRLPGYVETEGGQGMTLAGVWQSSYYKWINRLTPWKPRSPFKEWWAEARHDFANARATSFYR